MNTSNGCHSGAPGLAAVLVSQYRQGYLYVNTTLWIVQRGGSPDPPRIHERAVDRGGSGDPPRWGEGTDTLILRMDHSVLVL